MLLTLFSRMATVSTFYQQRSKDSFSILPAMSVMSSLLTLFSRMTAVSVFYPQRIKNSFSILPVVRVTSS